MRSRLFPSHRQRLRAHCKWGNIILTALVVGLLSALLEVATAYGGERIKLDVRIASAPVEAAAPSARPGFRIKPS